MAKTLDPDDEADGALPNSERMTRTPQTEPSPEDPDAPPDDTAARGDDADRCVSYPRIALVVAPIIVVAGLIRWLFT